jgi:hypothetical protein
MNPQVMAYLQMLGMPPQLAAQMMLGNTPTMPLSVNQQAPGAGMQQQPPVNYSPVPWANPMGKGNSTMTMNNPMGGSQGGGQPAQAADIPIGDGNTYGGPTGLENMFG